MHEEASFCWENVPVAMFLSGKQQFGFALGFAQNRQGVFCKNLVWHQNIIITSIIVMLTLSNITHVYENISK